MGIKWFPESFIGFRRFCFSLHMVTRADCGDFRVARPSWPCFHGLEARATERVPVMKSAPRCGPESPTYGKSRPPDSVDRDENTQR